MERLERVSFVCVRVCWYDTDGACVVMPEREREGKVTRVARAES